MNNQIHKSSSAQGNEYVGNDFTSMRRIFTADFCYTGKIQWFHGTPSYICFFVFIISYRYHVKLVQYLYVSSYLVGIVWGWHIVELVRL